MTELYAFVAYDPDEGIVSVLRDGTWMPMVTSKRSLMEQMLPIAQKIANERGKTITVIRLSGREEVNVIRPRM